MTIYLINVLEEELIFETKQLSSKSPSTAKGRSVSGTKSGRGNKYGNDPSHHSV